MDFYLVIRYINILLALLSIPPSLYLMKSLIKEGKIIDTAQKKLNDLLVMLFGGSAVGALLNAVISTLSIMGVGTILSRLSLYRSIYISSFFTLVTWGVYLYKQKHEK